MNYTLEVASFTDSGKVRPCNEDSIVQRADTGVLVLADGMGAYQAGELASAMATGMIAEGLHGHCRALPEGRAVPKAVMARWIDEQVNAANDAILERARIDPACEGMGATLALAVFRGCSVTVAHLGDSRIYRLRDDQLQALTCDHSLLAEQVRNGLLTREQARHSHNRSVVTRALGVGPRADTEIRTFDTRPEDIFLLCSDGLTDMVDDGAIRATVEAMRHDLALAATNLVQLANDCGGRDNVSVILARVLGPDPWWSRLYGRLHRAA